MKITIYDLRSAIVMDPSAMELGSDSASFLPPSQDHISSSSNGGSMDSSLRVLDSCNGAVPPGVSEERDEMVSKELSLLDKICTQVRAEGLNASMLENLNQNSAENGHVEAGGDTLQETCKGTDKKIVERERFDLESAEPRASVQASNAGWEDGMETGDHVSRWISAEKSTSAANVPERMRPAESLAALHNASQRMLPASRRRTFFIIRMPRAADSELRSKIKLAELQLEEASKTRDVIRAALQLRRASKIELLDKLKVVRDKERACKDAFQKKRVQIDPFQTVLNKFKSADFKFKEEDIFSEEDLNNKIACLQHRIQHESISLKEEKQLIREIKQLESQRSQVCANDAEHAHLLESYGAKEDIQDQLDILYKELDVLRVNQNQARLECEPIEKELEDLNVKLDELVDQLEGAKRSQGAALAACKELKKVLGEQNAEFYKNREDVRKAKELASFKNLDELAVLCYEQVERILSCWNNDSGFRERYLKHNEHSTLRRLETLDGRSLGPDEELLLLMSDMDVTAETVPKSNESGSRMGLQKDAVKKTLVSAKPGNNIKKLQADEVELQADKIRQGVLDSIPQKEEGTDLKKFGEKLTENVRSTRPSSSVTTTPAPVEDAAAKEAQATERKEKRRQEEIAKAKEAAERKKRQAERAQAKAQLWEKRDAERREKEREKKARKRAAVGSEDLKPGEGPAREERERELVTEDLSKESVKGSSSQGPNQPKSRRHPVIIGPHSKSKMWQIPAMWLWVSLVMMVIGLALTFVAKF